MRVVGWLFVVLLLATCSAPGGEAGPLRTLTVRVTGDGVGRVRSVPLGIDCGEGCTTQLPLGARVEVTATAQAGSTRKPWAGCPTPREGLCQLTLMEDTALEVRFDLDVGPPIEYVRLQIDRQGGGRVTADLPPPFDCGSFCRADVPKRQQLTLTAVPDRGSYFAGWGGACQGAERTCEIWVTDSPQDSLQVIALFSPQVCAHPNFCWDNPIPTGMPVNSVVRFADDDILAMTGDQGSSFLRWNGIGWMAQNDILFAGPQRGELDQIWASSRSDIWARDIQHRLWHFDGTTFSQPPQPIPSIYAVHGRAPNDVWVVGSPGASAHFDGTTWTAQPTGVTATLVALWVAPDGTAWAGGSDATLLFWDGTAWTRVSQPLTGYISKIVGSSTTDVWAIVSTGMLHFDGTSWTDAVTVPRLTDIQVLAPDNIWGHNGVQVHHNDGTGWLAYSVGPRVSQMIATARDVWVFGDNGEILRKEGALFRPMYPGIRLPRRDRWPHESLRQVWMADVDNAWAVGDSGVLLRYDGSTWTKQAIGTTEDLTAIAGTAPDDIWVAGRQSLLHFDGTSWQFEPLSVLPPGDEVLDLFVRPGKPLFVLSQGEGVYERLAQGTYYTHMKAGSPSIFNSVCLFDTGDGEPRLAFHTRLYRWRGGTWVEQPLGGSYSSPPNVGCGGGVSPTDYWLVSLYGYDWYHHNGSRIDRAYRASLYDLPVRRVIPIASNNIWTLQYGGPGLGHYDGKSWELAWNTGVALFGGHSKDGGAFLVGSRGAILSYRP
ncbi:MAG TPA: hypothetical protein PKI03_25025 [Pseudomonadota bacterium]|nr:hypothetical protein [Pseudomonadota bacterium]